MPNPLVEFCRRLLSISECPILGGTARVFHDESFDGLIDRMRNPPEFNITLDTF